MDVIFQNFSIILFKENFLNFRPDTFIYSTADHSGFLLPQTGAYFVINYKGKNEFIFKIP